MQSIYKCKYYTKNENMNHTCSLREQMCKIYYNEKCKEYKEKEDEICNSNSINNCNGSNSDCHSVSE